MNFAVTTIGTDWFQPFAWVNIALWVMLCLMVVFSLLIYRQARQMTQVLPTPLSPPVTLSVIIYILATLTACILGVGIVVSSL